MSKLFDRIQDLAEEIGAFPLGNCSPSDDPDMQTAYVYSFLDIVRRFLGSVKRLDNSLIQSEIAQINTDIQIISEAYDLKAELVNVIDLINDLKEQQALKIIDSTVVSPQLASKLLDHIVENLETESANSLPAICENYGLSSGDVAEAFKSKRNYIHSRTAHLQPNEIKSLAIRMQGKYAGSELDRLLSDIISNKTDLNMVSEFEDIKELLIRELSSAKYVIWVAVAWFTDRDLANLLYRKAKQGVNVQIVINDDEINSTLSSGLKEHFETHLVPKSSRQLMHNKFCVIDLQTVVHGSYNWTNKAQYNNETATKIDSVAQAKQFADEFIRLKSMVRKLI